MDVQCGTDPTPSFARPSPVSSLTRLGQMYGTGIKIDDSSTNESMKKVNHAGISTATSNTIQNFEPTSLRIRSARHYSKVVKIDNSFTNITTRRSSDFGTSTNDNNYEKLCTFSRFKSPSRRSVGIKIKDSMSDLRKISHFGTSTDEQDIKSMSSCTMSPAKRTKGITIRDSYTDMCTGEHFDFGTVTNNAIEQYKIANTEHKSPEGSKEVQKKFTYVNGMSYICHIFYCCC